MVLGNLVAYKTRLFLCLGAFSSYTLSIYYHIRSSDSLDIILKNLRDFKEPSFGDAALRRENDNDDIINKQWFASLYPKDLTKAKLYKRTAGARVWDVSTAHIIKKRRKPRQAVFSWKRHGTRHGKRGDSDDDYMNAPAVKRFMTRKERRKRDRLVEQIKEYAATEWHYYNKIFNNNYEAGRVYTGQLPRRDVDEDDEGCVPVSTWHLYVPTTCNFVHEVDMGRGVVARSFADDDGDGGVGDVPRLKYMFSGAARQAWLLDGTNATATNNGTSTSATTTTMTTTSSPPVVLKTLRWTRNIVPAQANRQRRDAVATERLTSSPHVVDIYGYCSTSAINEYADGGDFYHANADGDDNDGNVVATPAEKLLFARDAALGLAAIHGVDGPDHVTTMVHHDIRRHNFLLVGGKLKYHDFNQARFLRWNPKTEKRCGFAWEEKCEGNDVDVYPRSPEECRNATTPDRNLSERVEIYRLGVFFFQLLTNEYPYKFEPYNTTSPSPSKRRPSYARVLSWILDPTKEPTIPREYEDSDDPAVKVLILAIRKAMEWDETKRLGARSLAESLDIGTELAIMLRKDQR